MARYTITYKCGHAETVQLYGKESDRQRKIEWYRTVNCPECEVKAQAEIAEKNGLPELTGSEKQIAWALKIRNKALGIISEANKRIVKEKRQFLTEHCNQWVNKETKASYWIDNRDEMNETGDILRLIINSTKV